MTRSVLRPLLGALLLAVGAREAAAQRPTPPPRDTTRPAPRAVPRAAGDTIRRDSLARDSAAADSVRRELVRWAETDSVFRALLERQGYQITRYQGQQAVFQVGERRIELTGDPAAVQQGEAVVVGNIIVFDDRTGDVELLRGAGGPVVLRDPSQGDDLVANRITYNLRTGVGTIDSAATVVDNEGERWRVSADRAAVLRRAPAPGDSVGGASAFWGHDGMLTSCELDYPHYHFSAREIKVVRGSIMVARNTVLHVGEVPILWLPFIFQDMRTGRRSGFLRPRFGVAELVRNSENYRRSIDELGYYFAVSDYSGASAWVDWRSGAADIPEDPGYFRYNAQWGYRWLTRFLTGKVAFAFEDWSSGQKNYRVSWGHQQRFSERTSFTTDINWSKNTTLVRRAAYQAALALAAIRSGANFQTGRGPFSISIGGTSQQYSGREDSSIDFPNLNVTSRPISAGEWLTWTPALRVSNALSLNNLVPGELGLRFGESLTDTTRIRYDTRRSSIDFQTPLRIRGFNWQNSFTVRDEESDQPIELIVYEAGAGIDSTRRVFRRTFLTSVDWNTGINLPNFSGGRWNVSPSVGIANVDPGPFLLRSQFSGGEWVNQTKRLTLGVGTAPTLYRRFGGFGPFEALRHSIQPSLSYSYAPAAKVGTEYLLARGLNPGSYIGALAQSAVTLNLSTVLEAKLREGRVAAAADAGEDSTEGPNLGPGDAGEKLRLLSLNFSPLTYDFIRADTTGRGLTNETFSINARSDLLPGFDLNLTYSLYNGPSTDLRSSFKPYRTGLSASFSVDRETNALALVSRVFGRPIALRDPRQVVVQETQSDTAAAIIANQPVAGRDSRRPIEQIPRGQGWRATINYTSNRSRTDLIGNVVEYDPTLICEGRQADPVGYQLCLDEARRNPPVGDQSAGAGGLATTRFPASSNVTSNMTFDLTPRWAGTWSTSYDLERGEFASHSVGLQRDLHDWLATFAFTQAPNGNFAFSFYISLKAAPDIKFDYDRRTFRGQGSSSQ